MATAGSKSPEIILGKYELGRLLGRGTSAKVYLARSLIDGSVVAVKVIDKAKIAGTTMAPRILREVSVMRRIKHPNVIRIHEVMATTSKIFLVMEHAEGGELFAMISEGGPLTEAAALKYFQQLVSGLCFCHTHGVAHRDVKPQNLLLDGEGNLKVTDFGLSALPEQLRDGMLHTACGTPAYTAPEVVRRRGYDGAKADVWSCGIILFVLLAGYVPFEDANLVLMYKKISQREYEFPPWVSPAARRVILRLLDPNPETRITMEGLMQLSWFKKSYQEPLIHQPYDAKDSKIDRIPMMNAFGIISLSSGLDLSGLFEGTANMARRFTASARKEMVIERVEMVATQLGYKIDKGNKGGVIRLAKAAVMVTMVVREITPAVVLVEATGVGGGGAEGGEFSWGDLKSAVEDLAMEWTN